jgi:hypothetical protein
MVHKVFCIKTEPYLVFTAYNKSETKTKATRDPMKLVYSKG